MEPSKTNQTRWEWHQSTFTPSLHLSNYRYALCLLVVCIGGLLKAVSLIPRPSHHPVFAVCKNGGERPGPFYHMNDVSVYLGRQRGGGVPNWKKVFCACERYIFRFTNVKNSSAWGKNYKIRPQACSFDRGPLPPLCRHWHLLCDKMDQVCTVSDKKLHGQWECLGMRLQLIPDWSNCARSSFLALSFPGSSPKSVKIVLALWYINHIQ